MGTFRKILLVLFWIAVAASVAYEAKAEGKTPIEIQPMQSTYQPSFSHPNTVLGEGFSVTTFQQVTRQSYVRTLRKAKEAVANNALVHAIRKCSGSGGFVRGRDGEIAKVMAKRSAKCERTEYEVHSRSGKIECTAQLRVKCSQSGSR